MNSKMNEALSKLKDAAERGANAYRNLPQSCNLKEITGIDCSKSRDEFRVELENILETIDRWKINRMPCLYYFEISQSTKPIDKKEIIASIDRYRGQENARACSAKNPKYEDDESLVLYLGKIRKHLRGRMYEHFGFATNPKTGGLQLAHWATEIGLVLDLNIFVFQPEMALYLEPLEYSLAKDLRPLIGKH